MATEQRLVDAIAYCKVLREEMDYLLEQGKTKGCNTLKERMGLEVAIADLGDMPTVDAVEVVRCCDCQNCTTFQQAADSEVLLFCEKWKGHQMVDPTDFCSYGERRK